MARSATLGKHLTPKHQQRLSIDEVHTLWNIEIHQAFGRVPYQPRVDISDINNQSDKSALLTAALRDLSNSYKWQDEAGKVYEHDPINSDLIDLIRKGDLSAFRGKDPYLGPIPAIEVADVRIKGSTYFLDRDDLGCFLVARGQSLPRFWYESGDEVIYENRLAKQAESVAELREHLKAVIAENQGLERSLLEARPFMDPDHPHFAPELEAAVQLWLALFSEQPADARVAMKPTMKSWLTTNRPEAIKGKDGETSANAITRIIGVANPRKEGGRPRKSILR